MAKTSKVVVVGSFITDLAVYTPRFPVDGETVPGNSLKVGPGGKGSNQATAAKRAGADVIMITKLGDDDFSHIARAHYERENMTQKYVYEEKGGETGSAVIEIHAESAQNRIIVIKAANDHLTPAEIDAAEQEIADCDIILFQLEANYDAIARAMELAKKHGKPIVMNPAPAQEVPEGFFDGVFLFTPNETEAQYYSGIEVVDEESAYAAGDFLIGKYGVEHVLITLGKRGAALISKDGTKVTVPTTDLKPVDTTGAGDAFNGAMCCALGEGRDMIDAIKFSNCVASIAVTRKGSSPAMPYRHEVDELYERFYGKN